MSRHTQKLLVVLALCAVLAPSVAHAEPFTVPQGTDTAIATVVTRMITALNLLTWVLFTFLNYLLDPIFMFDLDAVSGEDAGLMNMLNNIWQLSRDLVNIVFAIGLIGTAVYTIVTSSRDFLNEHAKKFAMAVVLVNFSWFIPRVILDVSNVLAATIYAIPSEMDTGGQCTYRTSVAKPNWGCTGSAPNFTCECALVIDAQFLLRPEQANNLRGNNYNCILGNLMCYREVKMSERGDVAGYSAILNGLIINHGRLAELAQVPSPIGATRIDQLLMFIVREVLILVIHIALFFPLLAMTVAFLIRIPILWITIAFMPFYFLTFVGIEKFGEAGGVVKKIMDQFLKMAFLPAIVAIPLAIGFIMINAGAGVTISALDRLPIQVTDNVSNFSQLLWLMISLGVIWVGVFGALQNAGGVIQKASDTIKDAGQTAGRIAVKAPLSAVKIPSTNMTGLQALQNLKPRSIEAAVSSGQGLRNFFNKNAPGGTPAEQAERRGVVDKLKVDLDVRNRVQSEIRTAANTGDTRGLIRELRAAGYTSVNEGNLAEKLRQLDADLQRSGNGLARGGSITQADVNRAIERATPPAPAPGGAPPRP